MQAIAHRTALLGHLRVDARALSIATTASKSFDELFVELFNAQYPRVHRVVLRVSGDSELASDITQDAFLRLYKRGSLPDMPEAWLVTVALNLWRNAYGAQRRRRRLLTIERGSRAHSDPAPEPDQAVLVETPARQVRAALERLDDRDRQMLLLRAEGFSYREIATVLELHEASVGTLLARATRALREHFNDANPAS